MINVLYYPFVYFQSEYKALCDHCKNYAVELLELCRTNEEVMAALHGGADIHDLSRVRMAIKYEQKRVSPSQILMLF